MKSVDDLLGELTMEEKAAQFSGPGLLALGFGLEAVADGQDLRAVLAGWLADVAPHGFGHLSMVHTIAPDLAALADLISALQETFAETVRVPIPALIHLVALNGVVMPGVPTDPTAIAQAGTWNPGAGPEDDRAHARTPALGGRAFGAVSGAGPRS